MKNLDKKVIMLKFRDEILLNSITDLFNISNVEEYQKDAKDFFEITNTQILNDSNPELIITRSSASGFHLLSEILNQFGFKAKFLHNPIYEQGLAGQINNLIREIIQNEGNIGDKQIDDKKSEDDISPKSDKSKKQFKPIVKSDEKLIFPNFYNFFYIEVSDDFKEDDINTVLSSFQTICINFKVPQLYIFDYVHLRYLTIEASPPSSIVPIDNAFQSLMGFNDLRASGIVGENGKGITIFDCETAWCNTNINFPPSPSITFLSRNASIDPKSLQHGTQVRSILTSTHNSVTALCPAINFVGSPVFSDTITGISESFDFVENAILLALIEINSKRLNGIILIEQNYYAPSGFKPVESIPSVFLVIRLAYSLNVTIIEPAGNSNRNINNIDNSSTWSYSMNVGRLDRFKRLRMNATLKTLVDAITVNQVNSITGRRRGMTIRNPYGNSKAIIVGGYRLSDMTPSNNHGLAVTCFAQGESVSSFHYGNCSTSLNNIGFGETSAASAIMAGMVAIIQSISLSKNRRMLTPDEVKNELKRIPPSTGSLNIPNIMSIIRNRNSKIHISRA